MATKEQIKKAILDLAGNPSSGAIASLADAWADAIVDLDKTACNQADRNQITPFII